MYVRVHACSKQCRACNHPRAATSHPFCEHYTTSRSLCLLPLPSFHTRLLAPVLFLLALSSLACSLASTLTTHIHLFSLAQPTTHPCVDIVTISANVLRVLPILPSYPHRFRVPRHRHLRSFLPYPCSLPLCLPFSSRFSVSVASYFHPAVSTPRPRCSARVRPPAIRECENTEPASKRMR